MLVSRHLQRKSLGGKTDKEIEVPQLHMAPPQPNASDAAATATHAPIASHAQALQPPSSRKDQLKVKYKSPSTCLSYVALPSLPVNAFIDPTKNPKGRLNKCKSFWESIGANAGLLDLITDGYRIPFVQTPPKMFFKNNSSSLRSEKFVLTEIASLLHTGRIVEVSDPPHVVNPLSVSSNGDGTSRLILDLSTVNPYIYQDHIKFENWTTMEQYVQRGNYLWKFDISKSYHHVDIWEGHHTFLGFSWQIAGTVNFFVFTVLPFGITSGPFVFTKLMRGLVKHWRLLGIKLA